MVKFKCYERWQFPNINVPQNICGTYIRKLLDEVDLRLMCVMIYPYNNPEFEKHKKFYRFSNDSIPLVGLSGRKGRRLTELLSIFEDEWSQYLPSWMGFRINDQSHCVFSLARESIALV